MTNTEYIKAISDGLNTIRRNFGAQDHCDVQNAINYLYYNFNNPKSVLEDEDEEMATYRNALEFILLNMSDYEEVDTDEY